MAWELVTPVAERFLSLPCAFIEKKHVCSYSDVIDPTNPDWVKSQAKENEKERNE